MTVLPYHYYWADGPSGTADSKPLLRLYCAIIITRLMGHREPLTANRFRECIALLLLLGAFVFRRGFPYFVFPSTFFTAP